MRGVRRQPVFLRAEDPPRFPDPNLYDRDGLVAIGGDLGSARLLAAYRSGVFPWYGEGYVPMWWSPDPRALLSPAALHVGRSLRRVLARGGFELTWNRCFSRVMTECGRRRPEGTWVIPEMIAAYTRLHERGHAHSLEVWQDGELVGGTYGVQVGALFAAESKFHRRPDMSKVALVALVGSVFAAGIELFDVQFTTPHLLGLGAFEVPRAQYLARLASARERLVDLRRLVPRIVLPPASA
ncbi:MAG: leucyl/phenylalanyl-tRNA--protein transferase [Planctomycetes bacterium]|nr:leucyl/phenylalanyl-tRNA--protein transferase [Planctomycetota bacterium]